MFHYIEGELGEGEDGFCVVNAGGVGYKIHTSESSRRKAEKIGGRVRFYVYLHVREEAMDLYGFISRYELILFKKLIGVSGVGPKTGIAILNVAGAEELAAAINAGKPELLTRVSGIGKRTAERVVLELKDKIEPPAGDTAGIERMESEQAIIETLTSLGYTRGEAREALEKVSKETNGFETRLKEALKGLGK